MPFVAENLGASATLATFILGLYAWGQFISTVIWGRLSDRFGRKRVLLVCIGGYVALSLVSALAWNFTVLAVIRLVQGFLSAGMTVVLPAMAL